MLCVCVEREEGRGKRKRKDGVESQVFVCARKGV